MAHQVYLVVSAGLSPLDHHAIFVEMESDGSGQIFQVTGNIQNGMTYEQKSAKKPEDSATFHEKKHLGQVSTIDFPRLQQVCEGIAVPEKQFDGPKRLYPKKPLRRCQEWTKDAVEALISAQLIVKSEV